MTADSRIHISGLFLAARPLQRTGAEADPDGDGGCDDGAASMIESMWSSVASSMQLAQDCAAQEQQEDNVPANEGSAYAKEGIEKCAQLIDSSE